MWKIIINQGNGQSGYNDNLGNLSCFQQRIFISEKDWPFQETQHLFFKLQHEQKPMNRRGNKQAFCGRLSQLSQFLDPIFIQVSY